MKNIADIDSNFKVGTSLNREGLRFYDVEEDPFRVHGIFWQDGKYRRLPEKVAASVSEGVHYLHANTAGGRVRFRTDSSCVAISAKMEGIGKMPHFALTGSAGFDLYIRKEQGEEFFRSFVPPFDIEDGYESLVEFGTKEEREITINFPLYSDVCRLYIGLDADAFVDEPVPYRIEKPIVYYGSSITQGGCASRPGNCYQAYVSRMFEVDHINLGFSGSARGEDAIIDYMQTLDMSVFVCDYDHNAPSVSHLQNTHEKLVQAIRKAHPDIPIIIMCRPAYHMADEVRQRLEIVKQTYRNAVAAGDRKVYLVEETALNGECGKEGTVDITHPNDFGFAVMAKAVCECIEKNKIL